MKQCNPAAPPDTKTIISKIRREHGIKLLRNFLLGFALLLTIGYLLSL